MDVDQFLRTRPCLEELDGYVEALRWQADNPEALLPLRSHHPVVDADVLGPIEKYRARLMSGEVIPAPSRLKRQWVYKLKKKPQRRRTNQ